MRRRKQKNLRRALRFYKINHGFRAPFKVLVDGNFVNAILTLKYVNTPCEAQCKQLSWCLHQTVHCYLRDMHCTLSGLTVIHEMMCRRGDVQDLVPQFLGEKSRIFVTQCCLEELRKMGSEVSGVSLQNVNHQID